MPERELDVNLTGTAAKTIDQVPRTKRELTPEIKARQAQVLSRGLLVDRFTVKLPDDMYGEWVPNDESSISRAQLLGFEIDTEYAKNHRLHDTGDAKSVIGDVVFMTMPKEFYQAIEEHRRTQYIENHLKNRKVQKEESEFKSTGAEGTQVSSSSSEVTGTQIADVLRQKG
jgi:hypothetical protein